VNSSGFEGKGNASVPFDFLQGTLTDVINGWKA